MRQGSVEAVCKRILDITGALAALAVLWPVMAVVALIIWLTMGKPVLFRQIRPGQYEKPFTLLKYRPMVDS